MSKFILIFIFFSSSLYAKSPTIGEYLKKIVKPNYAKKNDSSLPQFKKIRKKRDRNLELIKPPRFSGVFDYGKSDYARIEKEVDRGISQLVSLVEKYKRSQNRGEYWLRLGEFYSEKAQLIEFRAQERFEELMQLYNQKKRVQKPVLNIKQSRIYNKKAIKLYKWFVRDFPRDPKVDQALFFLGYNYFELNQDTVGIQYYKKLIKRYKRSIYINETYFALAEYYFERQNWKLSYKNYLKLFRKPKHRLFSLSMYKVSWVLYKMGKYKSAFRYLDRVLRLPHSKGSKKLSLKQQAINSLALFYSDGADYRNAMNYFSQVISDPKEKMQKLEDLAQYYSYTGKYSKSFYLYKKFIAQAPNSIKSFDYQSFIVNDSLSLRNRKKFWRELTLWAKQYSASSSWFQANRSHPDVYKKLNQIENFIRSYTLEKHKTAQKNRVIFSQQTALRSYNIYLNNFKKSKRYLEMLFFKGELLFDMRRYLQAAQAYERVTKEDSKSNPYYSKALYNLVLSYEKKLPPPKVLHKTYGKQTKKVPFRGVILKFKDSALGFLDRYPKSPNAFKIRYSLAMIYYYLNHFDSAIDFFTTVISLKPKSIQAEQSANLILDIYNLKKDYKKLIAASEKILKIKGVNLKIKKELWKIRVSAIFSELRQNEKDRTALDNAIKYESFYKKYASFSSGIDAAYNSAINYEKDKKWLKALIMYKKVIRSSVAKKQIKKNALRFIGFIYRHLAQYKKATFYFEKFVKQYPNHKDTLDMIYNIALLKEGVGSYQSALTYYQKYLDRSKKRDRFEVLYIIANLWEKNRNYMRAISYYRKYINSPRANAYSVLESAMKIGRIQLRLQRYSGFKQTRNLIKKLYTSYRSRGINEGLSFLTEAEFEYIRLTSFKKFKRIRIVGSQQNQKRALEKRLKLINQIKNQLKVLLSYKVADQVVSGLVLQGEVFYDMYKSVLKAPLPRNLNRATRNAYRQQIQQVANPFKQSAIESLSAAIEKAWNLNAYNKHLLKAFIFMRKLNPFHPGSGLEKSLPVYVEAEVGKEYLEERTLLGEREFLKNNLKESFVFRTVQKYLSEGKRVKKGMNLLSLYYVRKNKFKMAKVVLNEALKLYEKDPIFYNNLGVIFMKEKNIPKAQEQFEKALKLNPRFLPSNVNLASVAAHYRDQKRVLELSESKGLFDYYARWGVEYIKAINNYAIALSYKGSLLKAEGFYLKALEIQKHPWVRFNHAFYFARFKNNFKYADENMADVLKQTRGKKLYYFLNRSFKSYKRFKTLVRKMKKELSKKRDKTKQKSRK